MFNEARRLLFLALVGVVLMLLLPFVGSHPIPISTSLSQIEAEILWKLRVPRILLAFLSGVALASAGVVFQGVFRNYLATPFTLGVASGAAFGAAASYSLGIGFSVFGFSSATLFALGGACLTVLFVSYLAKLDGMSAVGMLLAGVVVSFLFSSLIMCLQYLSDFSQIYRITRWLMGGFEVVGFDAVIVTTVAVAIGSAILMLNSNELNLLSLGDELAGSRGIDLWRTKLLLFWSTSLMVAVVVSFCGPIGFVGIMVPHICRLVIGVDHRWLIPCSMLVGGVFLALCDALARTMAAPAEIPVGVITSLLGGPFFLWLLLRRPASLSGHSFPAARKKGKKGAS